MLQLLPIIIYVHKSLFTFYVKYMPVLLILFVYYFQGGNDKDSIEKLIKAIKNSKNGKSVGIFGKEKYPGSFMDAWRTEFDKEDFNTVCYLIF